jgi:hypothetical protein
LGSPEQGGYAFVGLIRSDAKSVFNLLFADEAQLRKKADDLEHDGCERVSVGCWFHCRRGFWEAATAKCQVGARVSRASDASLSSMPRGKASRKNLRATLLRPHVDSFFAWLDEQREHYRTRRGYTRTALEYANNPAAAG